MILCVAAEPKYPVRRRGEGRRGVLGRARIRDASPSRGFTLLEVLLASVLMAMVLGALWEVLHVYSHLFESGGIEVRHARLITALVRQLTDDLHSAIEDSPRGHEAAASSAAGEAGVVRRFGLQGTADTLRVDVLQTLPEDQLPAAEDVTSLGRASPTKPQVPELKTVVYRFTPDRRSLNQLAREDVPGSGKEWSADAPLPGSGLSRWEIGFETPLESASARTPPAKTPAGEADVQPPSRDAPSGPSFEDLAAQTVASQAITWLPEVHRAAFRYFDGTSWSDSWNSLQRGSLPVAVEITLSLRDAAETDSQRRPEKKSNPAAAEKEDVSTETPDVEDQPSVALDENGRPIERQPGYRFLIRLPIARHRPEIQSARTSGPGSAVSVGANPLVAPPAYRLPRVDVPRDIPSPWSSGGPAAQNPDSPSHQWLRTAP